MQNAKLWFPTARIQPYRLPHRKWIGTYLSSEGAQMCLHVARNNALDGVTWIQTYVTPDRRRAFYLCDAPTQEPIRRAAERNKLPVDRITKVRILDPYFLV